MPMRNRLHQQEIVLAGTMINDGTEGVISRVEDDRIDFRCGVIKTMLIAMSTSLHVSRNDSEDCVSRSFLWM